MADKANVMALKLLGWWYSFYRRLNNKDVEIFETSLVFMFVLVLYVSSTIFFVKCIFDSYQNQHCNYIKFQLLKPVQKQNLGF